MYIQEFARRRGLVQKYLSRFESIFDRIANSDSLPYDSIRKDENGRMVKVVELSEELYIPVLELLSYSRVEDIPETDTDIRAAYEVYMTQVDVTSPAISDLRKHARMYREGLERKNGTV